MLRRTRIAPSIAAILAFLSSFFALGVDGASASQTVSIGFDVVRDGFGFANWGGLTSADDMDLSTFRDLFGDGQVCEAVADRCSIRPSAAGVLEQLNVGLGGGRCEGMVVLAAREFVEGRSVAGRPATSSMVLADVVERITYWWGTQFSPAVQWTAGATRALGTTRVAEDVFEAIARGEVVTMGLYFGNRGHSVLPIGATRNLQSVSISVYDPNFPGTTRTILVHLADGSWTYDGGFASDGTETTWSGSGGGGLDYVPLAVRDIPIVVRL